MTIGDLLFMLGVDGSRLESEATKEAQKAGDSAGKTMSQRIGSQLKQNGAKALGLAFSGAAALATKGALQMEDAVARIRSETGATQEQAEQIARASNRIAGDQQQSLDSVTDVAIAVKKNLGAVGEQLDSLTESTVKYARVTKQDAVGAVEDMDDIVDAYGLSLDDVTTVQDKLIVSNQKYGGSITENQKALAAMAPQLKALNLGYDDGIELLNLFAASGLNAADGQKALNTAIQKLPEGESLDEFVKRLASVKDDGERARLAMEVFGTRAGAKLANAIKPGIESLDQFGISAEDAAGATDEAVDALDSSLGGRLRKIVSQAKAALRGFGADLGPGITAAAGLATLASSLGLKLPLGPFKKLGAKLGGAIASGIGTAIVGQAGSGIVADSVADSVTGATRSGKVGAAANKLGDFLGTKLGKGLSVAFAAIAVVEVFDTFQRIKGEIDAQAAEITANTATWVQDATEAQIRAQLEAVKNARGQLQGLTRDPVTFLLSKGALDDLDRQQAVLEQKLDEITASAVNARDDWRNAMEETGAATGPALADGVASTMPGAITSAGSAITGAARTFMDQVKGLATSAGKAVPENFASGILSAQDAVPDAMDQLREQMRRELTPAQEIARTIGALTSQQLAKGLNDKRPGVRAVAQQIQADAEARLAALIKGGGRVGREAMEELRKKMRSKNPQVRAEAQRVYEIVSGRLDNIPPRAGTLGAQTAARFAAGIRNGTNNIARSAAAAVAAANAALNGGGGGGTDGRAIGGPVRAGVPYLVNERTAHSEVMVPSMSGRVLTEAQAVRGLAEALGAGGGTNITVPVTVQGAVPVRTARDIANEVQRAGNLGVPLPPRLAPMYPRREAVRS